MTRRFSKTMENILNEQFDNETQRGYVDQPQLPIFAENGVVVDDIEYALEQAGIRTHKKIWDKDTASMEGNQQFLQKLLKNTMRLGDQEQERNELYTDYSLFVVVPGTKPFLYDELNENTPNLILMRDGEYTQQQATKIVNRVGMENIFTDVNLLVRRIKKLIAK